MTAPPSGEAHLRDISQDVDNPEFQRNPYPFYARWRRSRPMAFDARHGNWLATTYADAVGILRDPRFTICPPAVRTGADAERVGRLYELIRRWALYENPPAHARLRKFLNQALSADAVSSLRPGLEQLIDTVLEECGERRSFEVIADLAVPITVLSLNDAMGLPRDDFDALRRWSTRIGSFIDGSLRPFSMDSAAEALAELTEYLGPIVQRRLADPGTDLISRIAAIEDEDGRPSEYELLATCVLLLATGHETTNILLGNAVVVLLEHPEERERLRRDPKLGVLAVEEVLRFESPIQVISRKPDRDVDWAGAAIAANTVVNIVIGSANRDEAQFANADRLDIGRTKNPHIAFALGVHFCPGAGLARLVTRLTIERLVKRFPGLELGPANPVRRSGALARGFATIPVHV